MFWEWFSVHWGLQLYTPASEIGLFCFLSLGIHFVKKREGGERNAETPNTSLRFSSVSEYSINVLEGFPFLFFYYSIVRLLDSRPFSLFPMPSRFLSFFFPCSIYTHRLVVVVGVGKAAVGSVGSVLFYHFMGPKGEENTHSKNEVLVIRAKERKKGEKTRH